jgi:LmbE family N-acetylglucosaminyl deacetylase
MSPHPRRHRPRSVLAIGAHGGDIENGCGGALATHRAAGDFLAMLVLAGETAALTPPSKASALVSASGAAALVAAAEASARALDCLLVRGKLTEGELRPDAATIAAVENVITGVDADVIYVHAPEDSNADHRAAAAATLCAARHGGRVLHYCGPSTLRFEPSVFVDVTAHLDRKLATLADPELAAASARHFGALARVRYAEAFAPTRFVWDL